MDPETLRDPESDFMVGTDNQGTLHVLYVASRGGAFLEGLDCKELFTSPFLNFVTPELPSPALCRYLRTLKMSQRTLT